MSFPPLHLNFFDKKVRINFLANAYHLPLFFSKSSMKSYTSGKTTTIKIPPTTTIIMLNIYYLLKVWL